MTLKNQVISELDKLPDGLLSEVYDFIKYLEIKNGNTMLSKVSQSSSQPSFDTVWDNEEDAVYDDM